MECAPGHPPAKSGAVGRFRVVASRDTSVDRFASGAPLRRVAVVALAALGIVGLAACGSGGEPGAEPAELPATVQAMWAEHAPWVPAAPPDVTYVPGPDTPPSVHVEALMQHPDTDPAVDPTAAPGAESAAETLYADPTVAEPWADRAVMVGRVAGSDTDGMFAPRDATTAATIQGTEGRVGRYGDLWFAAWPIPTCDVCTQDAFVIGHGLTRERVLAIAETVGQEPAPHADEATLPEGLVSMGSAPVAQGTVSVGVWPQELAMRSGDATATFQVWSGDPRLYAHLAFWSHDGRPVETWRSTWMDVVQRGDVTVTITGPDDGTTVTTADGEAFRAAAEALVPGDAAAVDAALADAVRYLAPLPSDADVCGGLAPSGGVRTTLSDVVGQLRWALTLHVGDGSLQSCQDLWFATAGGGPTGASAGPPGPVPSGGVRFDPGVAGSTGVDTPTVHVVAGDVPESAVRVVVTFGDESADAKLADVGPESGRRWFAVAFLSDDIDHSGTVGAQAYDAAGNVVASGSPG